MRTKLVPRIEKLGITIFLDAGFLNQKIFDNIDGIDIDFERIAKLIPDEIKNKYQHLIKAEMVL
jgi:hypothetical protein